MHVNVDKPQKSPKPLQHEEPTVSAIYIQHASKWARYKTTNLSLHILADT